MGQDQSNTGEMTALGGMSALMVGKEEDSVGWQAGI